MIRFGVIGYGYWGPNIVRNLRNLESAQVAAVCDKNTELERSLAKVEELAATDPIVSRPSTHGNQPHR